VAKKVERKATMRDIGLMQYNINASGLDGVLSGSKTKTSLGVSVKRLTVIESATSSPAVKYDTSPIIGMSTHRYKLAITKSNNKIRTKEILRQFIDILNNLWLT
jgi:hypothetical protein